MSLFGTSPIEVNVTIAGHTRLDFDRKPVRKALMKAGADVRKAARRLVARRTISDAGDYPGKDTGALQRSIRLKAGKTGFWVKVAPFKTEAMGKDFYPAYLWHGVKNHGRIKPLAPGLGIGKNNRRRNGERKALVAARAASTDWRIKPRANYMVDALNARREVARAALGAALQQSIIPRK